jgi:hypothetical protein
MIIRNFDVAGIIITHDAPPQILQPLIVASRMTSDICPPSQVYRGIMPSMQQSRREALISAAQLARVRPGADYDESAITSDAAAVQLIEFMRHNGEFALGLLQVKETNHIDIDDASTITSVASEAAKE